MVHFVGETVRRVRRAGARGPVSVRADSGFWSYTLLAALDRLGVGWSITCPLNAKIRTLISNIDKDAWTPIAYPEGGLAQVGETVLEMTNPKKRSQKRRVRLVVRRTRLLGSQAELWPDWRYHAFVTNLDLPAAEADRRHQPGAGQDDTGHQPRRGEQDTEVAELPVVEIGDNPGEAHSPLPAVEIDRYHRRHATCELAIRDLKDSGGLAHLPSGVFAANAAWLICAALAHNLYRQIALLGGTQPPGRLVCGRTIRTRLFGLPGRLVNHGGRRLLRLPARWPWAGAYLTTLTNLRALPETADPARRTRRNHNQPPKPRPHTPETIPTSLQHYLTHQTTPTTPPKPPESNQPQPLNPPPTAPRTTPRGGRRWIQAKRVLKNG